MEEVMITTELGIMPWDLDRLPQSFIEKALIFRGVKDVAVNGGNWQP
jgi:hypothetical protein